MPKTKYFLLQIKGKRVEEEEDEDVHEEDVKQGEDEIIGKMGKKGQKQEEKRWRGRKTGRERKKELKKELGGEGLR